MNTLKILGWTSIVLAVSLLDPILFGFGLILLCGSTVYDN
jgi:hypothetical protein